MGNGIVIELFGIVTDQPVSPAMNNLEKKGVTACVSASSPEKCPQPFILHGHMQVPAGNAHIRVARRIANLGQRSSPSQGMTDKCMPTVTWARRASSA
jgi:hypothetical protein